MIKVLFKRFCVLSIIAVLALTGCEKIEIEKDVPGCVQDKIKAFSKKELTCNTGAKVSEYTFQNQTVYLFDPGVCRTDQSSEVIDSDCNSLGTVGGWSGGQINGEEFSKAVFVRKVWGN
jgi:hypothetical protein